MIGLSKYHVDAFSSEHFRGNPAAVIVLDEWLSEEVMQLIAMENALAATAFILARKDSQARFDIRWFTPTVELPLCAHASLAAAWVIFERLQTDIDDFKFQTKAGHSLKVRRAGSNKAKMFFPVDPYLETPRDISINDALGKSPRRLLRANYSVAVFESEADVRSLEPDIPKIEQCKHAKRPGLVVATAPADPENDYDFVSRFFAPGVGIAEDPVTGSAHCILSKFWSDELRKDHLAGFQCSARGGMIVCDIHDTNVAFTGEAVLFEKGQIYV